MNLVLDEKKVRNGKPVGLPYVGSKKKVSKKIAQIIAQNFGTDKPVYDLFGGGGAVSLELKLNGFEEVHYNDLDKTITDMFNLVLTKDREWVKTLIVSRDEFIAIRDKENKTIEDELKLLVNSFGNNRENYLYSKELSDIKYKTAVEILDKEDTFLGYKKTKTYLTAVNRHEDELGFTDKLEKHRTLQQFGRLQQLERLQKFGVLLKLSNKDYHFFSNVKHSILYLDPPYESAVNTYQTGNFDSTEFYEWAYKMSKNNIVIISSYEVSDERFEPVFEFKNARSTLAGGTDNNRTEKLFMVKAGL